MQQTKTRSMALAGLCAALTAVLAPWSIVIGPVSLTLGVFGVFFAGAMLTPGWAAASMGVYLALGAVGLPIFSNANGGLQALVGMTGGYLWAYPLMAALLALACARTSRLPLRVLGVLGGQLVCYTLGTAWFMYVRGAGLWASLAACVFPFILPDFLKGLAALLLARAVQKRMR